MEKNIVSVVFDFDLERRTASPSAAEYTYFFTGPVKKGDLALVLSPRNGTTVGVLVTSVSPGAAAIRRATKSLVGIVDTSVYDAAHTADAAKATEEAWARYTGEV